jgi:hypothetical protein
MLIGAAIGAASGNANAAAYELTWSLAVTGRPGIHCMTNDLAVSSKPDSFDGAEKWSDKYQVMGWISPHVEIRDTNRVVISYFDNALGRESIRAFYLTREACLADTQWHGRE